MKCIVVAVLWGLLSAGVCCPQLTFAASIENTPTSVQKVLHYPNSLSYDARNEVSVQERFILALLTKAITTMGEKYELRPSVQTMVQSRALRELNDGQGVDIVWTMTSLEREAQYLPVRIPLLKGLSGWRLLLVKKSMATRLADTDLSRIFLVQGHDWPDTRILQSNNLRVVTSSSYDSLFEMLEHDRAVAFPRSVVEIGFEQRKRADWLTIEPSVILHYPTALYFFLSIDSTELAGELEMALNKLIASGDFDLLFHQYFDELLQQAAIADRKVIELQNPLLPPETPINRRELWYQPASIPTVIHN